MRTVCTLAILCLSLPAFHGLSTASSSHRAAVLVQAEKDFAALSVREGMKPAFMDFLADSGIVFRPRPVNGKKVTAEAPNPAITLDWVPSFADIAVREDIGYTTGPWIVSDRSGRNRPPAYGTYLSVWKKQPDMKWKVILDIGTSSPPHVIPLMDVRTDFSEENSTVREASDQGSDPLFALDRGFSQRERASQEYLRYAGKRIRLIREEVFPIVGADSALAYLERVGDHIAFEPGGGELSEGGDLGYTYGTYQLNRKEGDQQRVESGYYVHIWKRQHDSSFKLAVDLLTPVPGE